MTKDEINVGRRRFLVAATAAAGGAGVAISSIPFVAYWLPNDAVQAAGGPVEVNIGKLKLGGLLTIAWRGKPVWIVRRTQEMINALQSSVNALRDPDSIVDQQPSYAKNAYRSIKPEYLVLIGICTHLGCAPTYMPGIGEIAPDWMGGFFCPCHGSKFDMAGRVYKGVPAPVNLEVPPYHYVSDTVIKIGDDTGAA